MMGAGRGLLENKRQTGVGCRGQGSDEEQPASEHGAYAAVGWACQRMGLAAI